MANLTGSGFFSVDVLKKNLDETISPEISSDIKDVILDKLSNLRTSMAFHEARAMQEAIRQFIPISQLPESKNEKDLLEALSKLPVYPVIHRFDSAMVPDWMAEQLTWLDAVYYGNAIALYDSVTKRFIFMNGHTNSAWVLTEESSFVVDDIAELIDFEDISCAVNGPTAKYLAMREYLNRLSATELLSIEKDWTEKRSPALQKAMADSLFKAVNDAVSDCMGDRNDHIYQEKIQNQANAAIEAVWCRDLMFFHNTGNRHACPYRVTVTVDNDRLHIVGNSEMDSLVKKQRTDITAPFHYSLVMGAGWANRILDASR